MSDIVAQEIIGAPADPLFSFQSFHVGPSNELAVAAARNLAEGGPRSFHSLLIRGKPGTGKSHLLHAIRHAFLIHNPGSKTLHFTADELCHVYIDTLKAARTDGLRHRLEELDLLLVDDVESLQDKAATSDFFLWAVDAVRRRRGRVVMTSNKEPKALRFSPRLKSRVAGSLTVELTHPRGKERERLVESLAQRIGLRLRPVTLRRLVTQQSASARELYGMLERFRAEAILSSLTI